MIRCIIALEEMSAASRVGGFVGEERMPRSIARPCGLICLAALFISSSLAQLDTGTITVLVKDPSGSAVPGASVTLRNESTGVAVRSGAANEQGVFTAALIPSGSYSVHVEVSGFKSYQQSAIYLQVNEQLSVPVSLH